MGRLARVVIPGLPHRVTQRGNRRARIFFSDDDRRRYLAGVVHYGRRYGMRFWAYCLMDNHVHWVVVPERESALSETFREAHARYGEGINHSTGASGHLFQGRFFSCPLDEEHLWAAVRYVERNPVRARLVGCAEDYVWSSASAHCGLSSNSMLADDFPPCGVIPSWREWLRDENTLQTDALRNHTRTGRPCGSPGFVTRLETLTDRILQPLKRGRKARLPISGQSEMFD